MRVAVIRADLPGPVFLGDLESSSQFRDGVDAKGQTRYLSRPSTTSIASYLASQSLSASASALVTATVPVGGPVDVSSATIKGVSGLSGATDAQVLALQDLLAPQFYESTFALESFQVGMLSKLKSSSYTAGLTPTTGAAVVVVANDGVTAFSAPLPSISSADLDTPTSGAMTITGVGLGSTELYATEVVLSGAISKRLSQKQILTAGGTVTATSIVIPASLLSGATLTTTFARVVYRRQSSAKVALT